MTAFDSLTATREELEQEVHRRAGGRGPAELWTLEDHRPVVANWMALAAEQERRVADLIRLAKFGDES